MFQELVHIGDFDIVCGSETWLSDNILDSELLCGYNIFRHDRLARIDGGVLLAAKEDIHATRRCDLECDNIELLVVQLSKP